MNMFGDDDDAAGNDDGGGGSSFINSLRELNRQISELNEIIEEI